MFSRFMQSYSTKLTHTLSCCIVIYNLKSTVDIVLMTAITIPFALDAIYGLVILRSIFNNREVVNFASELIDAPKKSEVDQDKFNNRLPSVLQEGKVANKMFNQGWKFNLFNVQGQIDKQIMALMVIFMEIYCSLVGIVNQSEHQCLSIVVLTYSLICMFSFMNLTYVRDFDAIQINITPVLLSIAAVIAIQRKFDFALLGMALALLTDSYCAIRFKTNSHKI